MPTGFWYQVLRGGGGGFVPSSPVTGPVPDPAWDGGTTYGMVEENRCICICTRKTYFLANFSLLLMCCKICNNKKVLLRERMRHTARPVAALSPDWGGEGDPHPVLTGGGVLPSSSNRGGGTPSSPDWGGGGGVTLGI